MKTDIIFFTLITIMLLVAVFYVMLYLNYDFSAYFEYLRTTNLQLQNKNLADLINGNGIGNLPSVDIITNDPSINQMQKCAEGPIFMGQSTSDLSCKRLCGNSGSVLQISPGEIVYSNGQLLKPGAWCTVLRPNCNLNTTYAVATVNSVACRPKYPRMFGGELGDRIVACNNSNHHSSNSVLMDNLLNQRVNRYTKMTNEDELLPDGSFRFTCRFGDDTRLNAFMPHPIDRLHPAINPCTRTMYAASRSIQRKPTGECDCGNLNDTRVANRDPNDPFSECTSCYMRRIGNETTISTDCYTLSSIYSDASSRVVCQPSRFNDTGADCQNFTVTAVTTDNDFPFHPVIPTSATRQPVKAFNSV